jgi:hypothetical protein
MKDIKENEFVVKLDKKYFQTLSQLSMRSSTTTFPNFISIIAATVSSSGRRSVGPKHTPKFDTVIKFFSQ